MNHEYHSNNQHIPNSIEYDSNIYQLEPFQISLRIKQITSSYLSIAPQRFQRQRHRRQQRGAGIRRRRLRHGGEKI